MHTCQGDLLRHIGNDSITIKNQSITNLLLNRDGIIVVFFETLGLATFTLAGKSLTQVPINPLNNDERILCAQLSRDGEYVVVGSETGRIFILRLFPLQLLYTYPVDFLKNMVIYTKNCLVDLMFA